MNTESRDERLRVNAPERIIVCIDGHKPAIADWAKDAIRECDVEYVRADLLTKAVSAAFQNAADYIRRDWLAAYPVEVFPPPPPPPANASRDSISAAMGRHVATKLIEHFEAAAALRTNVEGEER